MSSNRTLSYQLPNTPQPPHHGSQRTLVWLASTLIALLAAIFVFLILATGSTEALPDQSSPTPAVEQSAPNDAPQNTVPSPQR